MLCFFFLFLFPFPPHNSFAHTDMKTLALTHLSFSPLPLTYTHTQTHTHTDTHLRTCKLLSVFGLRREVIKKREKQETVFMLLVKQKYSLSSSQCKIPKLLFNVADCLLTLQDNLDFNNTTDIKS